MKNFGIGLALIMGGFACYLLSDNATKWVASLEGMTEFSALFAAAWPWFCLAAIIIGFGWFWILGPLLEFTRSYPRNNGE